MYRQEQTMGQMIFRAYVRHKPAMLGTVFFVFFGSGVKLTP